MSRDVPRSRRISLASQTLGAIRLTIERLGTASLIADFVNRVAIPVVKSEQKRTSSLYRNVFISFISAVVFTR